MGPLRDFPEWLELPIARWLGDAVRWVIDTFDALFSALHTFLRILAVNTEQFLVWLPWGALVVVIAAAAWRLVGWKLAAGVVAGFLFVGVMGLWHEGMQTLALVLVATALCVAVGLPTGIAMARRERVNLALRPVLDFMQTIPSVVLLLPAAALWGLGRVPALFATLIYAGAPMIRLTNLGIRGVPKETLEAGQAFGATKRQLLYKIQLPLGFPALMMGVNQTIMMALAMVVIAGFIGAPGLGQEVARALGRLDVGRALAAGLAIVVLAIIIDRMAEGAATYRERRHAAPSAAADEQVRESGDSDGAALRRPAKRSAVTETAEPEIVVRDVYKIFGHRPDAALELLERGEDKHAILRQTRSTVAVHDASFEVYPGETFVIMGLSGSGKSTLVRLLNRLIEATRGDIRVAGQDVRELKRDELTRLRREKFGMVFQRFALLPHRTVLDNVAFGLEIQGVGRDERHQRARDALVLVGLTGWEDSRPEELSGGMQQRVGLARALASDPDILLMDEPFSALDPLMRRQMQEELIDLQARLRKTIVFITHDLDEAIRLGDRVAIMKDGRIVQLGTPEDIILRPADDYVASFVEGHDKSEMLTARDVMIQPQDMIRAGYSPAVALRLMQQSGRSRALVVGPGNRLLGAVTADAVADGAGAGVQLVSDLPLEDVPTTLPEESVRSLIPVAAYSDYPIAVVEDGALLGLVGRAAILRGLTSTFDSELADELVREHGEPAGTG
jgi:glycine betaine/proline transport system ATP-binding protein